MGQTGQMCCSTGSFVARVVFKLFSTRTGGGVLGIKSLRYLGNYVHGLSKKPLSISVWKGFFSRLCGRNSDPWLAYALIKNNPEYAAKVVL
ncbi:hypothetical protein HanHA300_Chr07g0232131 [Helianthus annuus]|nr:hypothetical protein HanHA300_Chr07g0232131 [Helianthus annuus]KAJ0730439.1 hypothetical protein HanOQP8_Chr07g0239991 [Helianthus annuus]